MEDYFEPWENLFSSFENVFEFLGRGGEFDFAFGVDRFELVGAVV